MKKAKENKLVSCDEIKLEYLSSKMGNIGCDQKNNNIMEIDEFKQYKNEKNKEELNYRTYKSEKNPKI